MTNMDRLETIYGEFNKRLMEELSLAIHEGDFELVDALSAVHDNLTETVYHYVEGTK